MFSSLFVCLLATLRKFSGKVGPMNKFCGDLDHRVDTGIVFFRIRHYWEIRKVVNGHKSAAHTDSPDGGTGKTCLDEGMHCPIASSCNRVSLYTNLIFLIRGF